MTPSIVLEHSENKAKCIVEKGKLDMKELLKHAGWGVGLNELGKKEGSSLHRNQR